MKTINLKITQWKKEKWQEAADEHFQSAYSENSGNLARLIRFCVENALEVGPETLDHVRLGINEVGGEKSKIEELRQEAEQWEQRYNRMREVRSRLVSQSGSSPAQNSKPLEMASLGWAIGEALSEEPKSFEDIVKSVREKINIEDFTLYLPHEGKTDEDAVMEPEEVIEAFLLRRVNKTGGVEVDRVDGKTAYKK